MKHPCVRPFAVGVFQFFSGYPMVWRAALALLWLLAAAPQADAASAPQFAFDLPEGHAEQTLKLLAERAGLEVVFSTSIATGVRTHAVKGEFSALDAARRMLEGSPLNAAQKSATAAIVVSRRAAADAAPGASPSSPGAPADPKKKGEQTVAGSAEPSSTMKPRNLLTLLAGLFAVGAPSSEAQTVAATNPAPAPDETLVLSPFVVATTQDTGYLARQTLAGNRLRTNVNEVGAALSIYTPEFLSDIGATNAQTLLSFTPNAEVGGSQGNFAGGTTAGGKVADQDEARVSPQNNQRIRGLAAADNTRDYFLTDIPFDSYNTSQVTINRGANALLFGIGSPGGVIDNATIKANPLRDAYTFSARFDHRGSYRGTADLNKVIVPDRLALRLATLGDKTEYKQQPAFDRDERVFGTAEWVIRKGASDGFLGRSAVRVNVEHGEQNANPVKVTPPADQFSHWFSLPTRSRAEIQAITGTVLPAFYDNGLWVPRGTANNFLNQRPLGPTRSPFFRQVGIYYNDANAQTPGWGNAPGLADLQGGQARAVTTQALDGQPQMDHVISGSLYLLANWQGFIVPTVMNRNVFDYRNRLITGDLQRVTRKFEAQNIQFEQTFLKDRAGFEVSFDRQDYALKRYLPFNDGAFEESHIHIDLSQDASNSRLNNRVANPNLGRVLIRDQSVGQTFYVDSERDSLRATAFATLDFKDINMRWGAWLGRHTLTGLYQHQEISSMTRVRDWTFANPNVNLAQVTGGADIRNALRWVGGVFYIGDDMRNATSADDVRFSQVNVQLPRPGEAYNLFYFDPADRRTKSASFTIREFLRFGAVGRREIEAKAVSLQSHWLKDNLVTMVGWRNDEQKVFERIPLTLAQQFPDALGGELDPATLALQSAPTSVSDGDTFTYSLVLRYPENILPKLPGGMGVRAFYNESENFNPVGIRRTLKGGLLSPPTGTTEEAGFILSFADDRVTLRGNRFTTKSSGASAAGNLINAVTQFPRIDWIRRYQQAEIAGIPFQEATGGQPTITGVDGNGQNFTVGNYAQMYQLLLTLIPEPTRSLYNPRLTTISGVPDVLVETPTGLADTADTVAKGWEFEVVGNVTRQFRLLLNVAKQESVQSNIAPVITEVANAIADNIRRANLTNVRESPNFVQENTTFMSRYNIQILNALSALKAQEGTVSTEQRRYRVNAVANYAFNQRGSRLFGFDVGAAARWQSKIAVGYPIFLDANNLQVPDISRPYYADPIWNGDVWVGYKRKIFRDRVQWRVQLNARNLFGNKNDIPVAVQPTGELGRIRIPNEQQWLLTNTFSF